MTETSSRTVTANGRSFLIRHPTSEILGTVIQDVFDGREYPLVLPGEFRPQLIVDVGANVGAAAIWFHAKYPDAKIISYEPSPGLFEYLERNTHNIQQINICNVGLYDRDTESLLYLGANNAAQNSVIAHDATSGQTETVFLRQASSELTALGVSRISILKIDTEGCEVPILRDLRDWLDRIDSVYVEYHSEADRRAIDTMLGDHFYLIHATVHFPNLGTLVYLSHECARRAAMFISPPLNG
ncbi:FkbM family methyltransferase [Stieleria varia]|uniref:Methyltransferase domain protein n=1 Tax=Stieleria varia TaxID=2528005 RepID=A0A5C6AT56_9BACT|nr:FkbM family methyltransferase [Stieleria varia]TWU02256.1 Methyltransferase domain protein [Stieleria varia]